jgi:hypothetical protein
LAAARHPARRNGCQDATRYSASRDHAPRRIAPDLRKFFAGEADDKGISGGSGGGTISIAEVGRCRHEPSPCVTHRVDDIAYMPLARFSKCRAQRQDRNDRQDEHKTAPFATPAVTSWRLAPSHRSPAAASTAGPRSRGLWPFLGRTDQVLLN